MPRTPRVASAGRRTGQRRYKIARYTPKYPPMSQEEAEGLAGDLADAGYTNIRVFMLPSRWCAIGDHPETGNAVAFIDQDRYNDFTRDQAARIADRSIDKLA